MNKNKRRPNLLFRYYLKMLNGPKLYYPGATRI
jgi:hypothetical protein